MQQKHIFKLLFFIQDRLLSDGQVTAKNVTYFLSLQILLPVSLSWDKALNADC